MNLINSVTTLNGNSINLYGEGISSSPVLIIGVFHGDEPQGKFLIDEYLKNHSPKNILFIPCLNPDGMALATRTNANGVDLNRNFPTKNWSVSAQDSYYGGEAPASEIETKFLVNVIATYNPSCILTLHTPYCVVNYDGPAKLIAEKISKIINYPVTTDIGYPTPGSFGTYCGIERNIPTITLELDEKIPVQELTKPVFEIFKLL